MGQATATLCPECNSSKCTTSDSRVDQQGIRRRRRHCLTCNTKWFTYEITAEEFESLMALKEHMYEMQRILTYMFNRTLQQKRSAKEPMNASLSAND